MIHTGIALALARGIGYLTEKEVLLIQQFAIRLPYDACCVNIGTGAGTSIIALLEVRPDLSVYAVDNNPENGQSQFIESGFAKQIFPLIGDSQTMEWKGRPIDMLFLDGGHLKHEIEGDIRNWLPRMNAGGVVMYHDYGRDVWESVKPVVDNWARGKQPLALIDTLIVFRV